MKKPSKNIKVEVIDSDSGEKKRRKQEDNVTNKIKKEKNGNQVQVKKEKTEEKQEVDKEYFVFINGEKQLVRVVTEQDRKQTENESDSSIKEGKQPKTLKPFYTVSDSDENEEKRKNLNQLDGNGDCIIVSGGSLSVGSSVEECGEKISLAPASLPSSYVTYSDTTDNLNRSIGDTLDELFNSNAHKSDHYVDSNADDDSNGDIKKYLCDECPERFFKIRGLLIHYKHAHNDDSATTEDKSSVDKYVLVSSSSADELEMLKKNADKSDTDKVKPIDLTESEAPEEETNSESEDKETEEKDGETEPTKDKQTEEKDGETEPTKDKKTEEKDVKLNQQKIRKLKKKTVKLYQK